jgi:hypothetical protein
MANTERQLVKKRNSVSVIEQAKFGKRAFTMNAAEAARILDAASISEILGGNP